MPWVRAPSVAPAGSPEAGCRHHDAGRRPGAGGRCGTPAGRRRQAADGRGWAADAGPHPADSFGRPDRDRDQRERRPGTLRGFRPSRAGRRGIRRRGPAGRHPGGAGLGRRPGLRGGPQRAGRYAFHSVRLGGGAGPCTGVCRMQRNVALSGCSLAGSCTFTIARDIAIAWGAERCLLRGRHRGAPCRHGGGACRSVYQCEHRRRSGSRAGAGGGDG